jgi:hypothetical protein
MHDQKYFNQKLQAGTCFARVPKTAHNECGSSNCKYGDPATTETRVACKGERMATSKAFEMLSIPLAYSNVFTDTEFKGNPAVCLLEEEKRSVVANSVDCTLTKKKEKRKKEIT